MASLTWISTTVKTEAGLRAAMKKAVGVKKGKTLIDDKFTKDHIFAGHKGDVQKLAGLLAHLRDLPFSTLMTSSMDTTSRAEVLSWIDQIPFSTFTYANGVWTMATMGNSVPGVYSYDFATVDFEEYKRMKIKQPDDLIKKSRKWLKESSGRAVKVVCRFTSVSDCTPVIYHLEF